MPKLIALCAAFGQDEANHGTTRYRVGMDGLVNVPPEVAFYLIRNGGFAVAKSRQGRRAKQLLCAEYSGSLVRLHHDTAGSCSFDGSAYWADEHGDVLVPPEAVADLTGHGFVPGGPEECSDRQSLTVNSSLEES